MKYYIMKQDKRMQNRIRFQEFPTDESVEFDSSYISKMKRSVTLHGMDDCHTICGDVIESPCYMVSNDVYHVIQMFDSDTAFSNAVFQLQQTDMKTYKVLLTDRIDVLHESTEYHKDKSIKKLVLDQKKIAEKQIFRIAGISPNYVVVSMAIAEAIIRRGLEGILFEEVQVA